MCNLAINLGLGLVAARATALDEIEKSFTLNGLHLSLDSSASEASTINSEHADQVSVLTNFKAVRKKICFRPGFYI